MGLRGRSPNLCQMLLLAKSCKKYLDLLEKSCNFAVETMGKSCRLPPIVYGIIDIGKVFGNATFLRCFSKNNANPFQNRNIRSQALKGYTSELLRSLNTEQLLLKILQESSKIHGLPPRILENPPKI